MRVNRLAGRLLESVPEVLDGSRVPSGWRGEDGSPPVGQGWVDRTTQIFGKATQRSERGREAHVEIREGSGVPPGHSGGLSGGQGGVWRPTRRSRIGREAHPEVQ